MRSLFFVLLVTMFYAIKAQDTLQAVTDVEKKKAIFGKELAGYIEYGWELNRENAAFKLSNQVSVGVLFEGFSAGLFFSSSKGELKESPFFPMEFDLPISQSGVFIGKSLYRGDRVQLYSRLNASRGNMKWKAKETGMITFEDRFLVLKPELQISYLPLSFLQLFSSIGYRNFYDLDLTQVKPTDYRGVTFNFGIRLGYFYRPKKE
ncbi:MAG: hypothetical protein JXR03_01960 [Cyclobacteriaceae bacterium]